MQVNQIYAILNDIMTEVTGGQIEPDDAPATPIVQEDLSNIVDVGNLVFNNNLKDNYVKSMINRIGREIFVDRSYTGFAPNILRDSWEYGSILSKTRCKIFAAKANPAWSLSAGQTVNQFEFVPPSVTQKFFNKRVAWQIECSFTDVQLRESFTSAEAMNRFYSMIENRIAQSMTIYIDSLIMRAINNFITEKIYASNGVVDVLALYNAQLDSPITAAEAAHDKDFYRFLAYTIKLYVERFRAPSINFNISDDEDGNVTFTSRKFKHLVLHSDIAAGMEVYLQSDTYHNELVKIGEYETVPFWQAQGNYELAMTSRIDSKLASDSDHSINRNYIIGVLFDRDAIALMNENRRTTSAYNSNGEYWTNFYKCDSQLYNSLEENGIVFVMGNGTIPTVTLDKSTLSLTVGGATGSLSATVSPVGSAVTWTSSDTSIATVSSGTVTAVKAGSCTISATITVDGVTYTAECAVTVAAQSKSKSSS